MPNWKKIVVSGSDAALNQITASSALLTTADINGGTIDGITSLTAGGNLDIGSHTFRAQTIHGDGHITVGDGGSDSISLINSTQQTLAFTVGDDTGDEYAQIGVGGLDLNYGSLSIPSDLRHLGDTNTKLSFTTDKITLTAGGVDFITMTEAASDTLVFGDVQTTFSGNITASGNISASGTITTDKFKANLEAGADNSVLIKDADGFIKTDEINEHVWESDTLLNSAGLTDGYIPVSDNGNVMDDSNLYWASNKLGIGIGAVTPPEALTVEGNISSSGKVQGLTGSFHALVGDTSQATSLEVDGPVTASAFVGERIFIGGASANISTTTQNAYFYGGSNGLSSNTWNVQVTDPTTIPTHYVNNLHMIPCGVTNITVRSHNRIALNSQPSIWIYTGSFGNDTNSDITMGFATSQSLHSPADNTSNSNTHRYVINITGSKAFELTGDNDVIAVMMKNEGTAGSWRFNYRIDGITTE